MTENAVKTFLGHRDLSDNTAQTGCLYFFMLLRSAIATAMSSSATIAVIARAADSSLSDGIGASPDVSTDGMTLISLIGSTLLSELSDDSSDSSLLSSVGKRRVIITV